MYMTKSVSASHRKRIFALCHVTKICSFSLLQPMQQQENVEKNTMFCCRLNWLPPQRRTASSPDLIGVLLSFTGGRMRGGMLFTVIQAWKGLAALAVAAELRAMVSSSCYKAFVLNRTSSLKSPKAIQVRALVNLCLL
jgi:hypothetical protein